MLVKDLARELVESDRVKEALENLKDAFARAKKESSADGAEAKEVLAAIDEIARVIPADDVCARFARAIAHGESPSPFAPSARDGKYLKPVRPSELRMTCVETAATLLEAGFADDARWRDVFAKAVARGVVDDGGADDVVERDGDAGLRFATVHRAKHHLALARSFAYRRRGAGRLPQALIDAKAGVAYAPDGEKTGAGAGAKRELASARGLLASALESIASYVPTGDVDADAAVQRMKRHVIVPSGAFANIVHDDLIVDAGVAAAVEHKRAWHLDGSDVEHKNNARRCAVTYCPPALRDLISSPEVSIETVIEWLEKDKLANAPEYVRPRPKYARYYESMRERIREHYPELPAPVMDKLLALDAGELDLLLQYPTAIRGQTEEFLDVYRAEGGTYLETYKTPALSWKEVKAMKGEGTVGLEAAGPGSSEAAMFKDEAPLFAASDSDDEDTNRAMLGASGDDGLTAEEEAGLVLNASGTLNAPALPPDQLRVASHASEAKKEALGAIAEGGNGDGDAATSRRVTRARAVLEAVKPSPLDDMD